MAGPANTNGRALSLCGAAMVAAIIAIMLSVVLAITLVVHLGQSSHTGTEMRLRSLERELEQVRSEDARLREELRSVTNGARP